LRHQGFAASQVGYNNGTVTYEGVVIGDAMGGTDGSALTLTFNGDANQTAVLEELLE